MNSTDALEEHLRSVFDSEQKMAILIALLTQKKLNLTQMTKVLGKSKSTLHSHVKELTALGLITLDREETESSRGKTYRLTKNANTILDAYLGNFQGSGQELFDNVHTDEDFRLYIQGQLELLKAGYNPDILSFQLSILSEIYRNLVRIGVNSYLNKVEQFISQDNAEVSSDDIIYGSFVNSMITIPLSNADQHKRLLSKIQDISRELEELTAEFEAEGGKPNNRVTLFLSGVPEIDPDI